MSSIPRQTPKWTAEEVSELMQLGPHEFAAIHTYRTFDGARVKYQDTRRAGAAAAEIAGGATLTVTDAGGPEDFERYVALLEDADQVKGSLSPTQDSTTFRAPDDGLPVAIVFTGDWHAGSSGVEYRRLRDDLKTIRETPGLYAIGMGDFVEGVTTHSKAAPALYTGLFNEPLMQERYVEERVRDAQGKWLALLDGNHDGFSYQHSGIRRTVHLATRVGVPYFPQGGGTVFCEVGSERYVVAVRHNAPGNSRLNTTNAQRRMFNEWPEWSNCDVIALAHFHYNDMQVATLKGGRCVYLRIGTYKTTDSYARDGGFSPEWGVPLVVLYPDEHRVIGFRGDDLAAGLRFFASERARLSRQSE